MDNLNGTGVALLDRSTKKEKNDENQKTSKRKGHGRTESRADSATADENADSDHPPKEIPPNEESQCTMPESEIKVPKLQLIDLKNIRLQCIYNLDMEELKKNIVLGKAVLEPKTFKFEILMCFWVTIHLELLEYAQYILEKDPLLEKILQNMRKTGGPALSEIREKEIRKVEDEENRIRELKRQAAIQKGGLFGGVFKGKNELEQLEKNSQNRSDSLKKMQSVKSDEAGDDPQSSGMNKKSGKKKVGLKIPDEYENLTPFQREYMAVLEKKKGIADIDDLQDVHWLLKNESGQTFNTNIMRIALNLSEEKIASLIVSFYNCKVDDEMVLRAIKTQQIYYVYCMFVYNRNYEELMSKRKFDKLVQAALKSSDNDPDAVSALSGARFKVFTLDYVIKKVLDYGEEKGPELVEQIANWQLKSSENILKAFLKNNLDDVAQRHILTYIDYADTELLSFCIMNNNEVFLKYCLRNGIYSTLTLSSPELIQEILRIFKSGSKTELILNVMMYMNLLKWSRDQIKQFVAQLSLIVFENHERNPITISYNPILIIALACEQLKYIEDQFLSLKHECKIVHSRLLILGDKILDNFDDEKLTKVFLDSDFKDRTLLKIITVNKFDKLFENYKVGVILEEIWQGKFTFECDGDIKDMSLLTHLAQSPIKRVKNQRLNFSSLIFNGFSYDTFKEQKYWFQYKFRTTSISYIYQKDLISAMGMVVVFQLINFTYLDLFKEKRFDGFSALAKTAYIEDCIKEYNKINFLGTIFSSALVFHLFEKILFNCFAYKKLIMDTWTIIDFVSAAFNLFCFNVIGSVKPSQIEDPVQKQVLNYYVICVTIVCWIRFFGYFLMIRMISKLMHTLFRMVQDTLSFIFLISCYFMIMSTIFTMLFQVPDNVRFGSLAITLRTLFDAMTGEYGYLDERPNFSLSFTVLMIFHVFMSNIFLLNYLVAILATVYTIMTEYGEFEFRCNKYQYIEKYSTPMLDKDGYKELVIHPPPLNFFTMPIIMGSCFKGCMKGCGDCFSKFMFWLENLPFIFVFLGYEVAMILPAYFNQIVNIVAKSNWKNFLLIVPFWIIMGLPICLVVGVLGDMKNFLAVLCDFKLRDEEERIKVEEDNSKDRIILFNELIDVMRAIMHIYKKKDEEEESRRKKLLKALKKRQERGGIKGAQAAADFLDQYFLALDMENQGYVLEKGLIKQAWAKYRPESAAPSPREGEQAAQSKDRNDLNQVFGQVFIEKLIKGLKNRLYKGRKMLDYEDRRRRHKENQKMNKNKDDDDELVQFRNDFAQRAQHLMEDDPLRNRNIPIQELQMVDDFLNKFIFLSQGTISKSQIDINLVLKALPARIDMFNLYRIDMIGFSIIQKSLIAFQNDDQDELFIHYDDRTKQRLRKLNINLTDTEAQAESIKDISYKLLHIIDTLLKGKNKEDEEDDDYLEGDVDYRGDSKGGKKGKNSRFKKNRNDSESDRGGSKEGRSGKQKGSQKKVSEGDRKSNPYDEVPVVSEYTKKLKEGIDIYKKKTQKLKKMEKDIGQLGNDIQAYERLQMYLPQNLKISSPLRQSLAPNGPKENYVKDYSQFMNVHQQGRQPGQVQQVKRLYRPGGVNFKVDLHNERLGGIKDVKQKNNIILMQDNLRRVGVNDDFLRDLMRDNSPKRGVENQRGYLQDLNRVAVYPRGFQNSEIVTPGIQEKSIDNIFSDKEFDEFDTNNADFNNLSPPSHQASKFNLRVPKDDVNFNGNSNHYQNPQDRFTFKANDTKVEFLGEHSISLEDRKLLGGNSFLDNGSLLRDPKNQQSKLTNYEEHSDEEGNGNKAKKRGGPIVNSQWPKGPAGSNFKPVYD